MAKLFSNQRGIIHLIPLLLLLAGIVAGVYLVQKTQIFKPKAGGGYIRFIHSSESPDSCVTNKDGKVVTTCPKVKFEILVPVEVSQ